MANVATDQIPRLALSTITCPNWSLLQVLEAARRWGYAGIELRILEGAIVDLSLTPDERERVRRLTDEADIQVCCVDSSVHLAKGEDPDAVVRELTGFLEMAREWASPLVRVFAGKWPSGHNKEQVLEAMAVILHRALPAAKRLNVAIALETHDTFASAVLAGELLKRVQDPAFGMIWDINQPHVLGETPDQVLAALDGRILHVHIKDVRRNPNARNGWEIVPLGEGDLPVHDILMTLGQLGYEGWMAVEWPAYWHPELNRPEEVVPQHAEVLRAWLAEAGERQG